MYEKFLAIDEGKRGRILNAALKEFAGKGYEAASTNSIAKEADISKGLLFHYFTSKKALYFYLFDYSVDRIMDEIRRSVHTEERDAFVKLRQLAGMKLAIMDDYPDLFRFLESVYLETSPEVKAEMDERSKRLLLSEYGTMFGNVDKSKFREGIDADRAMNVILWTLEGLGEQMRRRTAAMGAELDIPLLIEEFDRYMEMLRFTMYKEETE